jgi:acyl-CoA synthetase (AMP-forming)/AMP-acid ligase II
VWVARFREIGLMEGDRVILSLPRNPSHVMATIAAWWEGLTLCPSSGDALGTLEALDARVILADLEHPHCIRPDETHTPEDPSRARPRDAGGSSAGIALMLPGEHPDAPTTLTDAKLLHTLQTLPVALGLSAGDIVVNTASWSDASGFLVSLWASLIGKSTVVVEPSQARDISSLLEWIERWTPAADEVGPLPFANSSPRLRAA